MVKAHYQNDLNEYKRFGIFHTLRARWWYIAMLSGLFWVCGAGLLALGILRGDAGIVSCAAICFVVACGFPFLNCYLQVSRIKQSVARNRNFNETEQHFTFSEEGLSLQIRIGNRASDYEVPYAQILKAYETNTNFYLYIGRAQALIINKKDVDEGSVNELCALLRKGLKKRFREKKKLRKS